MKNEVCENDSDTSRYSTRTVLEQTAGVRALPALLYRVASGHGECFRPHAYEYSIYEGYSSLQGLQRGVQRGFTGRGAERGYNRGYTWARNTFWGLGTVDGWTD